MTNREHIPVPVRRQVLVEAGHRCAIPTCRATTTEVAHITAWAKSQDHSPENLIALCPNCHTRYDRGEIDKPAMKIYKQNLGIVTHRYGELERRIFLEVAKSGTRLFILGAGGDLLCANAVNDGLLEYQPGIEGVEIAVQMDGKPYGQFPTQFAYWVTDQGIDFATRYSTGRSVD